MKQLFLIANLILFGVVNFCFAQGIGTIDASFTGIAIGFDNIVYAIATQADGKILVGGDFENYNGVGCPDKLVRLLPDGAIDDTFNMGSGFNRVDYIFAIATQADGKILVGGYTNSYNNASCSHGLIRLLPSGAMDDTFNDGSGFNGTVTSIAVQANGKIIVAGFFNKYNDISCSNFIVRLNSDGTIDNEFNASGTGFNAPAYNIQIQTDGIIVVSGEFSSYNGLPCPGGICRLTENGAIDNTFNPGGSGIPPGSSFAQAIALQTDGKILVGGVFNSFNGATCPSNLIRLNSNGTIDNTFNSDGSGFDQIVTCLLVHKNGKIIAGGNFTSYNSLDCTDYLTRLTPTGSLDNALNNGNDGPNNVVFSIAEQLDGKILVGGGFNQFNGIPASMYFARLNSGRPLMGSSTALNILADGASLQGNVSSAFGSTITKRGFCYSTTSDPTIADGHTDETGNFTTGYYTMNASGLSPNTIYHARPYAENAEGISYANEITFTTIPTLDQWGLIAFGGLIAVIGGAVVWRRVM